MNVHDGRFLLPEAFGTLKTCLSARWTHLASNNVQLLYWTILLPWTIFMLRAQKWVDEAFLTIKLKFEFLDLNMKSCSSSSKHDDGGLNERLNVFFDDFELERSFWSSTFFELKTHENCWEEVFESWRPKMWSLFMRWILNNELKIMPWTLKGLVEALKSSLKRSRTTFERDGELKWASKSLSKRPENWNL